MRLTLIAYGTRGDVQPFLSLAYGLRGRGHQVRLVAPTSSADWVRCSGIELAELPVDVQALFAAEEARRMLARGDILSFFCWLARVEDDYRERLRQVILEATQDADAILTHPLTEDRAAAVGAARRIPVVPVYFYPLVPSRHFPSAFISTRDLGPLNPLTHALMGQMLWRTSSQDVAALRRHLGLGTARQAYAREVQQRRLPTLLAYSPLLAPPPPDYGPQNRVTGDLALPDGLRAKLGEEALPKELTDWIAAGSMPLYLGFGSLPVLDTWAMLEAIRAALSELKLRAVIGAGWSNLPEGGDAQLFRVGAVNHVALFERCLAAVHHGGAGTTHATLRAGLPSLICAVFADNPFWGSRLVKLGVGDTFPFKAFSRARLVEGLRRILSGKTQQAAANLGLQMRAEDGLSAALETLEHDLPNTPHPN